MQQRIVLPCCFPLFTKLIRVILSLLRSATQLTSWRVEPRKKNKKKLATCTFCQGKGHLQTTIGQAKWLVTVPFQQFGDISMSFRKLRNGLWSALYLILTFNIMLHSAGFPQKPQKRIWRDVRHTYTALCSPISSLQLKHLLEESWVAASWVQYLFDELLVTLSHNLKNKLLSWLIPAYKPFAHWCKIQGCQHRTNSSNWFANYPKCISSSSTVSGWKTPCKC